MFEDKYPPDTSDIPEVTDWSGAEVGKFFRPKQLSIQVSSVESLIDSRAAEAHAEVRRMTDEAIIFINRSCGQLIRYNIARIEREIDEFWKSRNSTVEKS
jgi:hypothetical protein